MSLISFLLAVIFFKSRIASRTYICVKKYDME